MCMFLYINFKWFFQQALLIQKSRQWGIKIFQNFNSILITKQYGFITTQHYAPHVTAYSCLDWQMQLLLHLRMNKIDKRENPPRQRGIKTKWSGVIMDVCNFGTSIIIELKAHWIYRSTTLFPQLIFYSFYWHLKTR